MLHLSLDNFPESRLFFVGVDGEDKPLAHYNTLSTGTYAQDNDNFSPATKTAVASLSALCSYAKLLSSFDEEPTVDIHSIPLLVSSFQ